MAKRSNGYGFKGEYDHESGIIGEHNSKTDTITYYSLRDALAEFSGKKISITFKEEDGVTPVDAPDTDLDDDEG